MASEVEQVLPWGPSAICTRIRTVLLDGARRPPNIGPRSPHGHPGAPEVGCPTTRQAEIQVARMWRVHAARCRPPVVGRMAHSTYT